ncbi:MAG TPA: hypothetical protein GYA07_16925 [Verrucomicrobia bacterium]|nr:hypothetical protein [Verrucomicrobiota bacterium]HOP97250.1 hypothetical protein [Verrucomicrobiota bacterium]HPU56318.1 hypothetical protein [Verrucomicrobiota bacterium]
MSLGRLLTSGKSLIGLHGPRGRYEMRRKALLPKFGPPSNNPYSASPASQTDGGKFQAVRRTLNESEQQAAQLKETRRMPVVKAIRGFEELERTRVRETGQGEAAPALAEASAGRREDPPSPASAWRDARPTGDGWLKDFVRSLNPVGWWRRWRARRTPARPGRAPVQTELSLDNIKVVRNDLNDAEAAPVRVAVTPAVEEPPPAQPVAETPELIKV